MSSALFQTKSGSIVSDTDVVDALREVRAHEAEILFVHSEISFGTPVPALARTELLGHLHRCLLGLGVPTIVMPTFTFSFCNGVDYDVRASRSKMGALNEYFRRLPDTVRSVDPLMSCAAAGRELELVQNIGRHSCGERSTFDLIHRAGSRAKFLFVGVEPAKCMTYTHYVEERLAVPYRYGRDFTGQVTDARGVTSRETYQLYVRYHGVTPIGDDRFQAMLLRRGLLARVPLGDNAVFCVDEPTAYRAIAETIEASPDYFITEPFDASKVSREFRVKDMVAL